MRVSLRYRLLGPLVLLLLADIAATWWAAAVAATDAEERIQNQLNAVVRTLAEPPTFPLTPRVLHQMKGLSGADFILRREEKIELTTFFIPYFDPTAGNSGYRVQRVILPENHPNAGGVLQVCYSESLRTTAIRDAVRPTILLGIVVGIVAVILVIMGSSVVNRVRALEQRTRTIAGGDFQPVTLPSQQDELRDLAHSINEMAAKLAEFQAIQAETERIRVLGQFSGGLAHQLRNAAAGANLALQLVLKDDELDDREPLDVALRQLARIEGMLSQYLSLGRPGPLARKPVDLSGIIEAMISLYRPQCQHAGVTMAWINPGPMTLTGDPTSLGHLVGNLIGNAIEAAGQGGTVEVSLNKDQSVLRFTVADTGPGPSPEIAERLFESFVTGREQGVGLGLAVAKQAAEAHCGTIRWERRDGQTVFVVEIPAS